MAKGASTEIGGALLFMGAAAGSYESGGATLLMGGLGVTGVLYGGATLQLGLRQTAASLNGTVYESQFPNWFEAVGTAAEFMTNPVSAGLDSVVTAALNSQVNCQEPKPLPPKTPQPKSPPGLKGPGGGGGGNGPNMLLTRTPDLCVFTYTWYDLYSGNKYVGSGPVSVSIECF